MNTLNLRETLKIEGFGGLWIMWKMWIKYIQKNIFQKKIEYSTKNDGLHKCQNKKKSTILMRSFSQ